ncbi:MAG: CotH kinase family protein [Ruminococcus sp.]|nr:CotH kinase family protein [Ruminococcus sp.]
MKRPLALMLAGCMLLSGCASSESSSEQAVTSQTTETQTAAVSVTEPVISEPEPEPPPFEADPTPLEQEEKVRLDYTAVMQQYEENRSEHDAELEQISAEKDVPCVFITTQDSKKIISKNEFVPSVIDVFNCEDDFRLTANGGVKIRGNSTADQSDEKPYRIKFEEKHNMLGLNSGREYKSWVLLRSYWNLAPDHMAFNLAKTIFEGKYYCSDSTYVNLYINGEPCGVYLLCEQNQAAKGRIEVSEPKKDDTGIDIGYLLEMDNYPSDEHPFFELDHENANIEDISGESRVLESHAYSVKSDINTEGQLEFIGKYLEGAFDILYQAAENGKRYRFDSAYNVVSAGDVYQTPYEAADAVFDLESLANMLILEELVHNYDVGAGSFYIAVDFSKNSKYPKLTFLAPWDFNWAYYEEASGQYYACTFQKIQDDGYDRSNPWFITAMKADWFRKIVTDKWAKLSEGDAIIETTKQVTRDCNKLKRDLGDDSWKIDCAKDIAKFVVGRVRWLDKQWKTQQTAS